ncbi:MAG: cell envelope integrity protein TolA [Hyphomicrobium sp.]
MYLGLLISFAGHAALLAWALISVHKPLDLPDTVTIEATIVTPSEFTRLKQGNPDSKKLEAKAKEEPKPKVSKKEAPKPKPETAPSPPEPEVAQPPPEPKEDVIAKKIEEERIAALKLKAEEKKKAEEKRKAEEKKKAEKKRKAEEKKKAEKKRKAEEKRKKLAEAKRKAAEAKKKKKKFDADRIAALIDKSPDKRGAPHTSTPPTKPTDYKGPTAGVRRGTDSVLSAREQELLKSRLSGQLKRCWHLPGGGGGIETMVVTRQWRLKQDGSLDGVPKVVRPQSGPVFQIAAEAAMRAVTRCAPFNLPRDKYAVWKSVTWSFDPRDMM